MAASNSCPGHAVLGAGWDGPALPRFGEPQALDMLLGQGHGCVKTDDGEIARHVQDGLDDGLAHFCPGIIQLGGIVPGHGGAVVAVVNISGITGPAVEALENHCCVGLVVIMVFDLDAYAFVVG